MIVNRRGGLPIASAVLLLLATVPAGAGRLRWTLLPGLPGEPVINSVAIDPQDAAILYAAVQQWPLQFTNRGGGVARSVDGGATWKPMSEGLSSEGVAFLKISGVDDHLLFAESGGGFYRSENSAATWTRLGAPIGNDSCRQILTYFCDTTLSVSALQRATVYAADQTGVFKSLDAGRTWVRLADPSPLATGALQIEADPSRAGILYARTFYS
ncbi:MAG TPA: hypothetical protein VFL12_07475, partial [Thermoanaerobaculia bacterium]|nr:hypothetical protein [Thermoanaerobaculia bacterium]